MLSLETIFGEELLEEYGGDILHEIRNEDVPGVTNVKENLDYNSGWYNYSTLKFDYEGNRYSIEYSEHTSDNVCDFEFLMDTLTLVGSLEDLDKTFSGEEYFKLKVQSEKQAEHLNKTIKTQKTKIKEYEDLFGILNKLSKAQKIAIGEMLVEVGNEKAPTLTTAGQFFLAISK